MLLVVDFGNKDGRSSVADWPLQQHGRHMGDVVFHTCAEKNISVVKGEALHDNKHGSYTDDRMSQCLAMKHN